jgi:hypothetical protein
VWVNVVIKRLPSGPEILADEPGGLLPERGGGAFDDRSIACEDLILAQPVLVPGPASGQNIQQQRLQAIERLGETRGRCPVVLELPPQRQQVVAGEFADALGGLTPAEFAASVTAFARTFWADPDRHRTWRVRLLEARREIVAGTLATLAQAGRPTPAAEFGRRIADRFTAYRDEQMGLFPDAIEVLDGLRRHGV